MMADLQPLRRWWDQRTLRERWIVLGGGVAALLLVAEQLAAFPLEQRMQRERAAALDVQQRVERARAAALVATSPADAAPRTDDADEAQLHRRVATAQRAADELRRHAAEATRLPETLRAITGTVGSLKLLALDLAGDAAPAGLDGAPTAVPAAPAAHSQASSPGGRLYRLPITFKVSGSYDELQLLLMQIERHADSLQWATLTLERGDWPAIQLTFKAHVLSPEPRWGAAS